MTGIAVNKEELKKKNLPMPESYEDLTKPEYKGTLVMPHPSIIWNRIFNSFCMATNHG